MHWKRFWLAKNDSLHPEDLIAALAECDGDVLPNIRELILIGATSPIGSCEAERSFSALRRIKTHLRSTMSQDRLAGLTLMAVHYAESKELDTKAIVKHFVQDNPRCLFLHFNHFYD